MHGKRHFWERRGIRENVKFESVKIMNFESKVFLWLKDYTSSLFILVARKVQDLQSVKKTLELLEKTVVFFEGRDHVHQVLKAIKQTQKIKIRMELL